MSSPAPLSDPPPAQPGWSLGLASLPDTARFARAVASVLRAGDIVLLIGDLGAGKTTLTQGVAAALGVSDDVTSPTFTLMRHHATTAGFVLLHLDAYRLHGPDDYRDLAVDELLDAGAVAIVEWGDVVAGAVGPEHLDIRIVWSGDDSREVAVRTHGDVWATRTAELTLAFSPWAVAEIASC